MNNYFSIKIYCNSFFSLQVLFFVIIIGFGSCGNAFASKSIGISSENWNELYSSDSSVNDDDNDVANSSSEAKTMIVSEWGGTEAMFTMTNIRKLVFTSGSLNIVKYDNSDNLFNVEDIQHLTFSDVEVGIDEPIYVENKTLEIYPNPVDDVLNVDLTGVKDNNGIIRIYNLKGKVLLENKLDVTGVVPVNLKSLSSGIYLLTYSNAVEVKTVKIIKQ